VTITSVAIAVALIVVVLARRIKGQVVPAPKKLFLLPIILGIIGLQNMAHVRLNTVDITVVAIGCVVSLGLGLLRGRADKVTVVDGLPLVSWSTASVAIFAVNVLAKVALDAGGVAAGGTTAALSSSLLLSLGLTLLGEAAVVWLRSQSAASPVASPEGRYRGTVQAPGRPTVWPPIR
jgi:hypothetical protein